MCFNSRYVLIPLLGINFRDISTQLADPTAFADCIEGLIKQLSDLEFDSVAGIESRGFIYGIPIAQHFKKKFVMIRKPSKLPGMIILTCHSKVGLLIIKIQEKK